MSYIVGLDVSTAVTGIALLDAADGSLLALSCANTTKCDDMWLTADLIQQKFDSLVSVHGVECVDVYVEEDLQRFRKGFSSAHTLSTLSKINGIVTYMARNTFKAAPHYIQSSAARKLCGVKIIKAVTKTEKKDPFWVKRQIFDHMTKNYSDLSTITWPLTKPSKTHPSGHIRNECYDMMDAYVIATAAYKSRIQHI